MASTIAKVTFNGEELIRGLAEVDDTWAERLNQIETHPVSAADVDSINKSLKALREFTVTYTFNLTFVRVRPAAPIRSCLWRRNLDGGAWRKRGHVAHRLGG